MRMHDIIFDKDVTCEILDTVKFATANLELEIILSFIHPKHADGIANSYILIILNC